MNTVKSAAVALFVLPLLFDVPAGFSQTLLANGLNRPVALVALPDGRLLIGEQYTGVIRVFKDGALLPTPFATLSPIQTSNNETGLLGLCVHPNFPTTPFVYVFATQSASVQRVWRYTMSGDVGTSPLLLIDNLPTTGNNHNGGGIGFGIDGHLYVAVGDGGSGGNPNDAQDTSSLAGKILKYEEDGSPATGNPFGNAVYSYGHRHPFRFAFQPGTGKFFSSENGPNIDDEINVIVAGGNYGWPFVTGPSTSYLDPVHTFVATIAITDMEFYTGTTMPFSGDLFFADYKNDRIRRITLGGTNGEQVVAGPVDFVTNVNQPVDLEVGPDGAIYFCTLPGNLYRVQSTGVGNIAPFASFTATPSAGVAPLVVNFDASSSSDSDGSIVSYSWDWGDGTPGGSGPTPQHTFTGTCVYSVTLTVTDNLGATGSTTQEVSVTTAGNQPPTAHIESTLPFSGPAPLTVSFQGHGHDDTGPLNHSWNFGDGSAPAAFTGVPSDQNVSLQHTFAGPGTFVVVLTITDPQGVCATHSVTIGVTGSGGGGGGGGGGGCGLLGLDAVFVLWMVWLLRRRRSA